MEKNKSIYKIRQDFNMTLKRPATLSGYTKKFNSPCGSFFLTLNEHEDKLYEIIACIGKSGSCQNLLFRTITLLISAMLQSGMPKEKIKKILFKQFEGNCGNGTIHWKGNEYHSCVDFMVQSILEDLANRGEIKLEEEEDTLESK